MIDFTIRLGDLLTMAGLFGGGVIVITFMRADLRALSDRVGILENKLDSVTNVIVEQAKHDQRIAFIEQEMRDFKNNFKRG